MSQRIKAYYVHGDGGLWKLTPRKMKLVQEGASLPELGTELSSYKNLSTGLWKRLPPSLYQDEEGNLAPAVNGVRVMSYDEL